jgi:hypothetical protein
MKNVLIPSVIRPAQKQEVFGANDVPISNVTYFLKNQDDTFSGPYLVDEFADQERFIYHYIFRNLYVLSNEHDGFPFVMNLRPALRNDLAIDQTLRVNQIYFIRESPDVFDGPHILRTTTDVDFLATHLAAESIFVIDEEQQFTPYKTEKSA